MKPQETQPRSSLGLSAACVCLKCFKTPSQAGGQIVEAILTMKIISTIPGCSTTAKTILVTGATGTVGSEVVNQLSNVKSDFKIKAAIHSIEDTRKTQERFTKVFRSKHLLLLPGLV